jgi:hypothetical protein
MDQTKQVRRILNEAAEKLAALLGHPVTIIPHDHKTTNIVEFAGNYFKLNPYDIISEKRQRKYIIARTAIVYLMTELEPSISLTALGKAISRDHATVLNIRKKYEDELSYSGDLERTVRRFIRAYIYGTKDWNKMSEHVEDAIEAAKAISASTEYYEFTRNNANLKKALEPFMAESELVVEPAHEKAAGQTI